METSQTRLTRWISLLPFEHPRRGAGLIHGDGREITLRLRGRSLLEGTREPRHLFRLVVAMVCCWEVEIELLFLPLCVVFFSLASLSSHIKARYRSS